ncbi:hypothetical protein CFB47_32415 [Burkholderia sp. AU27893]|uniref:Uncharacterized protein n=1 Tax=Burkholderia contaminans TaxID=488447 RepID=A0A2S5DQA1_9BURK|nr:hypothetical protein CFB47_32415 [Burkholderia sp. AU27893]POZ81278.1 hypothetical protein C3743_37385 [Burkholderia contaminans]
MARCALVTGKRPRDGVTAWCPPRGLCPCGHRWPRARRLRPGLRCINDTATAVPGQTRIASAATGNFA